MTALELADNLDANWWRWKGHQVTELEAADMLRRQHEAIVKLREALSAITVAVRIGHKTLVASEQAQQALKDTEEL